MDDNASPSPYAFPFQDPDLPPEARIWDLIGRLTLEEKVGQMSHPDALTARRGGHGSLRR